jgi:hypothetical protein
MVMHLGVQGAPREQWEVQTAWVSDATGNRWPAFKQGPWNGNSINNLSYLAPADGEPLRFTVECDRGTDAQFPEQELWHLNPIKVPQPGQRIPIGIVHSEAGTSLKLLGITGVGAAWAQLPQPGIQPSQSMPVVYIEVTGDCQPYLDASDETGRRIKRDGWQNAPDRWTPASGTYVMDGKSLN